MDLRQFFESEAQASLAGLREAAGFEAPNARAVLQSARLLQGASLLAREERIHGVAAALAASLAADTLGAEADFRARLAATVEDLEILIAGDETDPRLEARAHTATDRWGGSRAALTGGATADSGDAEGFVAREAAAIADTMHEAVKAFQTAPADRDWLAAVLMRQRALLGSVHIDNIPLVGESLRAVEDLTGLIYRLDVPVKAEWLDIYRAGRDVLRSAHDALVRGDEPGPVPALSRLRTLHEELMSRYADRGAGINAQPDSEDARIIVEEDITRAAPGDVPDPGPAEPEV